jgi:hypothetical protein
LSPILPTINTLWQKAPDTINLEVNNRTPLNVDGGGGKAKKVKKENVKNFRGKINGNKNIIKLSNKTPINIEIKRLESH